MTKKHRILWAAPYFPVASTGAGHRRQRAILALLARRHEVSFACALPISRSQKLEWAAKEELESLGVRIFAEGWRPIEKALVWGPYDVVAIAFSQLAAKRLGPARFLQPGARVLVDSVDVQFLREELGVRFGYLSAEQVKRNKEEELLTYRKSDGVIVVTQEDRAALEKEMPGGKFYCVPIIVPRRQRPKGPRKREVLFIGGFAHKPNIDGIVWFSNDIWPRIREAIPEARLRVVGAGPTPEVQSLHGRPGIEVVGWVSDTAEYLDEAAVSVAPLRFGAGMKGKVCEALASGVPVVTTTVGAQGLGLQDGEHAMIADGASAFAEGVIRLLKNPEAAEVMGGKAQDRVDEVCGEAAVESLLQEMLDDGDRGRRIGGKVRRAMASLAVRVMGVGR